MNKLQGVGADVKYGPFAFVNLEKLAFDVSLKSLKSFQSRKNLETKILGQLATDAMKM
jgi:hypothetical protein